MTHIYYEPGLLDFLDNETVNQWIIKEAINFKKNYGRAPIITIVKETVKIGIIPTKTFEINSDFHNEFVEEVLKDEDANIYYKSIIDLLNNKKEC